MNEYDVPKVDVYIELKLSLSRLEKREEIMLRQKGIDILKKKNAKSIAKKQLKEEKCPGGEGEANLGNRTWQRCR